MTLHVSPLQAQHGHGLIKHLIDDAAAPGTWTVVEPMVGIVGVSLPLMTPIFRKIKAVSTHKSSEGSSERGWYHTRLGSSQRKAEIPLANHEEWTDTDTTLQANHSSVNRAKPQDPIAQCHDTDLKSVV